MALGKPVTDFTFKVTSLTFTVGSGDAINVQGNVEGTATGFGPVLGTTTFTNAGKKSGTFTSTPLAQTLHTSKVESVVVTGVTTDVCVGLGAREAADRGYQTIIVEDACTTFSAEMHRANLDAFCLAFGRVRSTEEVVQLLSGTAA